MFSIYFTPADTEGILEERGTLYANPTGTDTFLGIHSTTWAIVGVGVLVSTGMALFGKSPVYIGVSLFSTFFLSIWNETSVIIRNLDPTNNVTIAAIVTLIGVVIVVLTAFTIIDMFSAQGAME